MRFIIKSGQTILLDCALFEGKPELPQQINVHEEHFHYYSGEGDDGEEEEIPPDDPRLRGED